MLGGEVVNRSSTDQYSGLHYTEKSLNMFPLMYYSLAHISPFTASFDIHSVALPLRKKATIHQVTTMLATTKN